MSPALAECAEARGETGSKPRQAGIANEQFHRDSSCGVPGGVSHFFVMLGSVRGERLSSDGLGAWNQVESTGRHSRTQQKIGHVN